MTKCRYEDTCLDKGEKCKTCRHNEDGHHYQPRDYWPHYYEPYPHQIWWIREPSSTWDR